VNPVAHKDNPRENALVILRRVEEGAFADTSLEQTRQDFDARDSAFILELVYGTLRNRALLDWILNRFSAQPVEKTDRWTRNILRLGAYQMLFLDKVPVSAAVNTSVELAKQYGKKHGYVNALLRNLDRGRGAITYPGPGDKARELAVLYSHPEWLVRRWTERFGAETTEAFLLANNRPAPLVIRTNTLRTTRNELKATLGSEGVTTVETKYSPVGLEIVAESGIQALASYRKGWFMVQDQAAQLISLMLAPQPGETVLDACAAPGGKAAHLSEIMQDRGTLVALDADAGRIEKIRENIRRLGITIIKTVQGDAARYAEEKFDKILIDAPCSGLGVLRRHPDGRWNKSMRTISDRRILQMQILKNCAGLLKPGGAFVYATCTTEPEENEDVIADFMHTRSKEFMIDDPRPYLPPAAAPLVGSDGFFRTFPREPEMDGFFGVRMIKKS
jgi:16S rRNA (cytosine967-C5)-methyltransferase